SVIALAIQVTSWCVTRLRSAVTRPPPPRRAIRSPSGPRAKAAGPRFETTISFRRVGCIAARVTPAGRTETPQRSRSGGRDDGQVGAGRVVSEQPVEENEPVAQQPRHQE